MGTAEAATLVGTVLDARFRITGLIGVGSMGAVYRADDVTDGGEVAVKVLHRPFAADERAVARFRREARAASQLDHEGCVRILGFGIDGSMPYIAMELLVGETLHQLLTREDRLSSVRAVEIGVQVCAALEVAHEQGIVHRDLKPENIMLLSGWRPGEVRVKILDFGIAKLVTPMTADSHSYDSVSQRLTKPGTALGSPAFMAPEQARGDAVDDRTDIYVVGILLYEMVTGCVPFGGDDPVKVITAQLREAPPPPSELVPGLHPELERAILTCLEKSRAARWPTARVLRQFLEQLLVELAEAMDDEEATQEKDDDEDTDYGLTEPVDVRWARQRFAALRELGLGRGRAPAPSSPERSARETSETRVGGSRGVRRGLPSEQERSTAETRVVAGRPSGQAVSTSRETSETRIVPPGAAEQAGEEPDGELRDEGEDVPTIEVYDDDSVDVEMQIETVVKERRPIPGLEEAIARAKARTAELAVKRGGSAQAGSSAAASLPDEVDDELDTVQQQKDRLPPRVAELLHGSPARPSAAADVGPSLTAEDLDSVTQPQSAQNLSGQLAKLLDDSAMSVSSGDIEIVSEDGPSPPAGDAAELVRLTDDDSLDRSAGSPRPGPEDEEAFDGEATVARSPRWPSTGEEAFGEDAFDGEATVARKVAVTFSAPAEASAAPWEQDDDEDDALATAVKPLSEEDIDAALQTAVRPDRSSEIAGAASPALTRRADAGADAAVPTAVTRQAKAPSHDELATIVPGPEQAEQERQLAAQGRAATGRGEAPDWDEDDKPTTMMDRSGLGEGLDEQMRQALERELGTPLEPTVDEPMPEDLVAALAASSAPPSPARPRTMPLTAPLPAMDPSAPPPPGLAVGGVSSPSAAPGPLAPAAGNDDLDDLLRRMPRTRFPVLSTLMAIVVMVAAAAGLIWLFI